MLTLLNETAYTMVVDVGMYTGDTFILQNRVTVSPGTLLNLTTATFISSVHFLQVTPPPTPPPTEEQQALDEIMKRIVAYGDMRAFSVDCYEEE